MSNQNDAYVLDPATGDAAWSADWAREHESQQISITEFASPLLTDYLLLERDPFTNRWHSWVVDARTGHPVLDLRHWHHRQHVNLAPDGGDPEELIVSQYHGGATWFGRLRPDLSGVDTLGRIDGPERACLFNTQYALCLAEPFDRHPPGGTAELEVWRLSL